MVAKFEIDIVAFTSQVQRHLKKEWPNVMSNAFSHLVSGVRFDAEMHTRRKFKLKTDYIPKGIKAYPVTPVDKQRAARDVLRFGDMNAAVYIRGAKSPKRSLGFMAHHEYGKEREPQVDAIAAPLAGVKAHAYRTKTGRVKKRWKPSTLLAQFNKTGSAYDESKGTTLNKGRGLGYRKKGGKLPGNAFLIKASKAGNPLIVRRLVNPTGQGKGRQHHLEVLYALRKRVTIDEYWGFVDKVYSSVRKRYEGSLTRHLNNGFNKVFPDANMVG